MSTKLERHHLEWLGHALYERRRVLNRRSHVIPPWESLSVGLQRPWIDSADEFLATTVEEIIDDLNRFA
jgi:hypothetical protein